MSTGMSAYGPPNDIDATGLDLEAIQASVAQAESFSSMTWPAGAGWKQIGLCFNGATDPQVIFTISTEHLDQWRALLAHGHYVPALLARVAELEAERDAAAPHIRRAALLEAADKLRHSVEDVRTVAEACDWLEESAEAVGDGG